MGLALVPKGGVGWRGVAWRGGHPACWSSKTKISFFSPPKNKNGVGSPSVPVSGLLCHRTEVSYHVFRGARVTAGASDHVGGGVQ